MTATDMDGNNVCIVLLNKLVLNKKWQIKKMGSQYRRLKTFKSILIQFSIQKEKRKLSGKRGAWSSIPVMM